MLGNFGRGVALAYVAASVAGSALLVAGVVWTYQWVSKGIEEGCRWQAV